MSNYFQNAQKGASAAKSSKSIRTSAGTSITRTSASKSRNIILEVVNSKKWLMKSLEIFNWEVGSLSCVVAFVDTIICVDLK
jgi:hypothetical protein